MTDRPAPAVSYIIPSWNGLEFLKVVLPSLARQTFTDTETIIVDNGSSDGSLEYLKQEWPKVRVVALGENRGFAPAMNEGIAVARGGLIALLNNDLELAPDWTARMVEAAATHPQAGMFGGKVLNYYDRTKLDGAGEVMTWFSIAVKRGSGQKDTGQYDTAEAVFGPNTSAAVYRRELMERLGGLDRDFYIYLEDTDLHLRAQLAGFTAWYDPRAVAYHMEGSTAKRMPKKMLKYWHRNRVWLVLKNYPLGKLIRHFPKLLWANGKTLYGAIRHRELGPLLSAWARAWFDLPNVLRKRRRVQRQRTVSAHYLEELISSEFPEPSKFLTWIQRKPQVRR